MLVRAQPRRIALTPGARISGRVVHDGKPERAVVFHGATRCSDGRQKSGLSSAMMVALSMEDWIKIITVAIGIVMFMIVLIQRVAPDRDALVDRVLQKLSEQSPNAPTGDRRLAMHDPARIPALLRDLRRLSRMRRRR
jgi:hypothetical protein